jgi:hypothetical protein
MKKFFLSIGIAALSGFVYAHPVNIQTAQTVAANFMASRGLSGNVVLNLTRSYASLTPSGQTSLYVFDVNNGTGFVVVSGEDAVAPVLGYSTENPFPSQTASKEVAYWMNGYNQQISYVITNQLTATSKVASSWTDLTVPLTGTNAAQKPTDVLPLLTTLWDQMNPNGNGTDNTLYNNLCPAATPTGCVATAMAQIMKFWGSPAMGSGSHSYTGSTIGGTLTANFGTTTYDWANMPNQLHGNSTTIQKTAVATLMFHCGVGVNMDYNTAANGGSGAQVINYGYASQPSAQNALKNDFSYKSTIEGNQRAYYSDTQWINMLKFEIDNSRPVLYAGFGSDGGHAFDFDGYDNTNKFHINWGWSGQSNGYFTIDNLAPPALGVGAGAGNFNEGQQALIMIEPATSILPPNPFNPDYPTYHLALAASIAQSKDTIVVSTAYTATAQIKNQGTDTFQQGRLTLFATDNNNPNNIFILNQKTANINPGATYSYQYTVNNATLATGSYTIKYEYQVLPATDTNKLLVDDGVATNGVMLTVINTPAPTGISNTTLNAANLIAYPNPAKDFVTVDWKNFNGKVTGIQLYNVVGEKVYNSESINGSNMKIPVSQLSAGTYILHLITDAGTIAEKITVKK